MLAILYESDSLCHHLPDPAGLLRRPHSGVSASLEVFRVSLDGLSANVQLSACRLFYRRTYQHRPKNLFSSDNKMSLDTHFRYRQPDLPCASLDALSSSKNVLILPQPPYDLLVHQASIAISAFGKHVPIGRGQGRPMMRLEVGASPRVNEAGRLRERGLDGH